MARPRNTLFVIALLAGGLAVWLGVGGAGAASARTAGTVNADVLAGNDQCGDDTGGDVIGTAKYGRKGKKNDTIKVDFKLTHAAPNRKYHVQLWLVTGPDECTKLKEYGVIRTDAQGRADKKMEYGPIGVSTVFGDAYYDNGHEDNDSVAVTI